MTAPLWQPSKARIAEANLTAFMARLRDEKGLDFRDYDDLYDWSVDDLEGFWTAVWEFCGVIADADGARGRGPVVVDADKMPGARFFPEARLNFAENLLRRRPDDADAGTDALVFWGEDKVKRRLSHRDLYHQVSRVAQALAAEGVGPGDRVAGFLPNMPEAVIAMLATTALGAVWSSCSPDFGVQGVLDRFGQIEPKVLFCCDGYYYNGKALDSRPRIAEFTADLPSLTRIVVVPYREARPDVSAIGRAVRLDDFVPFNAPLYIMFSSGTTGKPKCIVHGAGGTLLQHLKEHILHCDVKRDDRVFYFTTCGWMMWNWLVSGLAARPRCCSTTARRSTPDGNVLFDSPTPSG
jgi:acetoacetyl-CoA synthetase